MHKGDSPAPAGHLPGQVLRRAARPLLLLLSLLAIPLIVGLVAFAIFDRLHNEEHLYRDSRLLLTQLDSAAAQQHSLAEHAGVMGEATEDVSWRLTDLRIRGDDVIAQLSQMPLHASFDELQQAWADYQAVVFVQVPGGFDPQDALRPGVGADDPPPLHHIAPSPERAGGDGATDPGAADRTSADGGYEVFDAVEQGDPTSLAGEWPAALGDGRARVQEAIAATDHHVAGHGQDAAKTWSIISIAMLVLEALVVALLLRYFHRSRRAADVATAERAALTASEARFRSLVQKATDIVTVADAQGRVTYESSAVEQVLGYSSSDRLASDVIDYVHPGDRRRAKGAFAAAVSEPDGYHRIELRVRHADGSWRWMDVQLTNLLDHASIRGVVLNQRDVGERKVLEEELRHQALHDPLTQLPNRVLFRDRIVHALARGKRTDTGLAILFVDLDNFKAVNDQMGHNVGDLLLATVAKRLAGSLRPGDTAARLGGDEFGFLLEEVGSVADAEAAAQRVLDSLKAPFEVDGREVFVGASVGVAIGDGSAGVEALLRDADFAMYMAKSRGRRRFEVFDTGLHNRQAERFALEVELRRAVERDEFVVQYQPITDLETGQSLAAETLIRWVHPTRGLLPPAEFIPVAEDAGLIIPMGRWVLGQACRQLAQWRRQLPGAEELTVSVNVSAKQLQQPSLVQEVQEALARNDLPASALTVEITESAAMHDIDAVVARLHELRALGVQIALDDFGVGYSSLGYLRMLPIDVLKIDRSFIDRLDDESEAMALVGAIITLARTLGLKTVAEGVERSAQLALLRQMGCDLGQGTYLAPPLDSQEAGARLGAAPVPAEAS